MPTMSTAGKLEAGVQRVVDRLPGLSQDTSSGHRSGTEGWDVAALETVNLDAAPFRALDKYLAALPEPNIHSLLVLRRGALVYERYFSGEDQAWGRHLGHVSFSAENKHDVRSISKNVTSLLTGIAIDRKMIGSIDEPVFKFLPAYADLCTPERSGLLVRHLLTMSAGFEWNQDVPHSDPMNSETRMIRSRDPLRFALKASTVDTPGEVWCFSGGTAEILGAVVQNATGQPLDRFARECLFGPLGITDFEWIKYPRSGIPAASSGLRLRPRDMAKLGQLVLQRGQWNGQQIVTGQWIDASIAPQIWAPNYALFYGYHWWVSRSLIRNHEIQWAAGIGLGGQRIYIVPSLDLVMVTTFGCYATPELLTLPLQLLNRYVLSAVKDI
jgi:CubicO group peptidase (beta-lactamase class C family)